MDRELIDKVDKFRLIASLKDCFIDPDEGNYEFFDHLETIEHLDQQRKNPEDGNWAMAFKAFEQGITADMINDYLEHMQNVKYEQQVAERKEREANLVELNLLTEKYKFEKITDAKQYPNHYHFKFNKGLGKNAVEIKCRMFAPRWGEFRLWYSWKDPVTKKLQRHCLNLNRYNFRKCDWMPEWWNTGLRTSDREVTLAFAWHMIKGSTGSFPANMPRPAKVDKTPKVAV